MDDGTLLREVYGVKFLNFAPSRQPYDLSNGLCYPTFEQLELELLFDSGHSYGQYGIILLISSYLFLFLQVFQPHHGSIPSTIKHLGLLY